MIAALYVEKNGVYYGLPNVDPWDEERDARSYDGPHRIIAHPPCAAWCRLAGLRQHKYGYPKGEDEGCFLAALISLRLYGGVLEHPAYSDAWKKYNLAKPIRGAWRMAHTNEWTTEVSQAAYGHRARKRTWLYYVGPKPKDLDWSEPEHTAVVSGSHNHCGKPLGSKRVWSREAKATPVAFRDALIELVNG